MGAAIKIKIFEFVMALSEQQLKPMIQMNNQINKQSIKINISRIRGFCCELRIIFTKVHLNIMHN